MPRTKGTLSKKKKEPLPEPEVVEEETAAANESTLFKGHFIKKLGFRAGVARIRPDAIKAVTASAETFLNANIEQMARRGEETKKKHTISFEHIRTALGLAEVNLDDVPKDSCPTFKEDKETKESKSKSGEVVQRKIEFYQKHSNCFILSRSTFAKEVRGRSTQYGRVQFAKEALALFQAAVEGYITDILEAALELSEHRNSKTVEAKDILLVGKFRKN